MHDTKSIFPFSIGNKVSQVFHTIQNKVNFKTQSTSEMILMSSLGWSD